MPNRSWFYASDGQQQGPYPDAQLRELIARGTVTVDTLVWSEGMAGWQRAGEIPGLLSRASGPPAAPAFRWPAPAALAARRFRSTSACGNSSAAAWCLRLDFCW